MPLDRMFDPRLGHSLKVCGLSDLEFRVWAQYELSADDFGVMRLAAVTVQADNDALAVRPAKMIQRCLERIVTVGLVLRFEHQSRSYVCQHDWQEFQRIEYPRRTSNPKPPDATIELCTPLTRSLLDTHPGGKRISATKPRIVADSFGVLSEALSKELPNSFQKLASLAGARTRETATATANGLDERLTAHGGSLIPRGVVLTQGASPGRPPVPHGLHEKLFGRLSPPMSEAVAQAELDAFYARVRVEWADREILPASDWDFWSARFDEWRPAPPKKRAGGKDWESARAEALALGRRS